MISTEMLQWPIELPMGAVAMGAMLCYHRGWVMDMATAWQGLNFSLEATTSCGPPSSAVLVFSSDIPGPLPSGPQNYQSHQDVICSTSSFTSTSASTSIQPTLLPCAAPLCCSPAMHSRLAGSWNKNSSYCGTLPAHCPGVLMLALSTRRSRPYCNVMVVMDPWHSLQTSKRCKRQELELRLDPWASCIQRLLSYSTIFPSGREEMKYQPVTTQERDIWREYRR
jgi:hypothetical protein